MSQVTVQPVLSRRQRKQFLQLPWRLYRHDPNWIPPLRSDEKGLLGYTAHPFYENNRIQTFLAYRDGTACGRIAAILNQDHINYRKERRGFFGFFESVDDQQVAHALFDAARQWLAERDLHCLRGPTNPGLNYTWGTLVDGFDSPPSFLMTYNPSYYPRLIEGYGFRKAQDLYAYYGYRHMLPESSAKLEPLSKQIAEKFDIKTRELDTSRFLEEVETFLEIYNRSMVGHWGFVPMSASEVRHAAKGLRHLILPELTAAAEIDGRPIGAIFCLPDYNPVIRRIKGRLLPLGFLRLLWAKRRVRRIRLLAVNVLPEYQRWGVGLVLLRALVPKGVQFPFQEVEYSWIAESNRLSRGGLEKGGAILGKTYRVYDWDP